MSGDPYAGIANMMGLGIMTMGAMVPIKIMSGMADEMIESKHKRKRVKGVVLPKVHVAPKRIQRRTAFEFETPKINLPKIKI